MRYIQILRCAQDDNEANPCHPERSEGSAHCVCGQRRTEVFSSEIQNAPTFREEPDHFAAAEWRAARAGMNGAALACFLPFRDG